jgi:anaerobic ribonucleoside-triphosphate reductase activating protein
MTWDDEKGLDFDVTAKEELFQALSKEYISGLTLSGGDPLYPLNRSDVLRLLKEERERFVDKTIWLYTGFDWEEVKDVEIMNYVDVLVDGQFMEQYKDVKAYWRGSSNQRVIDVQASLKANKIILHCK